MQALIANVMDPRLIDLLQQWRGLTPFGDSINGILAGLTAHQDHLLIVDSEGSSNRYVHYGKAFVAHFGIDLTNQVIDALPNDILPLDRRGMLAFEYRSARRLGRPLWRSYTANFADGQLQTWQRLVLPAGEDKLIVGAYPVGLFVEGEAAKADPGEALLRLLIERIPVVMNADGQVDDLALSLRTFSDTHQQVSELEVLANRDELTGVANRRHFHMVASLELEHARVMRRSFAMIALDIDHFKQINDRWGHASGDAALQAFVAACQVGLREGDVFGRLGGEEFAVALPNTTLQKALIIAERLRRQVEGLKVAGPNGQEIGLTVSVGVTAAHFAEQQEGGNFIKMTELLARADDALYQAKAQGRNRIIAAGADTPPGP